MVTSAREYRWSSYHANALGADDGVLKAHPIYERLGSSPMERRAHYRALFATSLSETEVQALRVARVVGVAARTGTGV